MNFYEFKSELIESILLIKTGIQKIIDPIAKSENLTSIQFYVLFSIYNGTINNVGRLSKEFGVNQGNVSTLCKDLEKMGLIIRSRNVNDERVVNLSITPKGKEVIGRLDKKIDELKNQFTKISQEKSVIIIKGIREFAETIKNLNRKDE